VNVLKDDRHIGGTVLLLLYAGFLLGLFFKPEDGSDISLPNLGRHSIGYMALYPRRQNSSNLRNIVPSPQA
jgi:hypothetical protein